jgi:hypothetical protein
MYYSIQAIANFRLPIVDYSQSAIGTWQSAIHLPARLNNAGDLTLQCQFAKTDATEAELP